MAVTRYDYAVNDTTNNAVDSDNLSTEIDEDASVSVDQDHIDVDYSDPAASDSLKIYMASSLTAPQKTALDAVVAAHDGENSAPRGFIVYDPVVEPVVPGASKVIANDRPATEIQDGITGFAAIQAVWPLELAASAKIRATLQFILKAVGTGTKVRIAFRVKADPPGSDTSGAFDASDFTIVPVTHSTLGESFEGSIKLNASSFNKDDALALQIGRDGNNEMGAGANDDIDVAIQIIATKIEGY